MSLGMIRFVKLGISRWSRGILDRGPIDDGKKVNLNRPAG